LPVWPICKLYGTHPASTTAREAPTAELPMAMASSSSSLKFEGSCSPRPPAMTTLASSSFGPAAASSCRSTRRAALASWGTSALTVSTVACPPEGDASKDLARVMTSFGLGPDSVTSTIWVPPKIWVWAYSGEIRSETFDMRVEPNLACSLPAMSRES
jgi:hypothetical protein